MALSSSSSRASLLPWLCSLLLAVAAAAAANQRQQQRPSPTLPPPPIMLPGCPDKCGNMSIPYPFGSKEGCFRPGFSVVCNNNFDPPRPFINSSLDVFTDTLILVGDYLISEGEMQTKVEWSAWPIELAGVSLPEGKARVLGGFSYECKLNDTHHSVRVQRIQLSGNQKFVVSDADNVLIGIGSDVIAEQSSSPLCQSYTVFSGPVCLRPVLQASGR